MPEPNSVGLACKTGGECRADAFKLAIGGDGISRACDVIIKRDRHLEAAFR